MVLSTTQAHSAMAPASGELALQLSVDAAVMACDGEEEGTDIRAGGYMGQPHEGTHATQACWVLNVTVTFKTKYKSLTPAAPD